MLKKAYSKTNRLRSCVASVFKGILTIIIMLMIVFTVPTPAYAIDLGDFIPSGPNFAALGPIITIVVAALGMILGLAGVIGILTCAVAVLRLAWAALRDNERGTSSALGQLKWGGIAIGGSLGGGAFLLLIVNIAIGIVDYFS